MQVNMDDMRALHEYWTNLGILEGIVFVGLRMEITLVHVLLLIAFYRHALNPSGFQELSLAYSS